VAAGSATPPDAAGRVLAFFLDLAAPLDARPDLARVLIPRSHLPGAVAAARAKRREAAIERIAAWLPADLPERPARAAFLMDSFLGVQLAWSKGLAEGTLTDRVRRDMAWAVAGALSVPHP
jgi:hypothetical protein